MSEVEDFFDWLVDFAESAPGILGLAITGSRSTGFHRPDSDFDCGLIVASERVDMPDPVRDPPKGFDLRVFTERGFAEHATWGSETAWDGYAWFVADFAVDRSHGELVALAREKGRVPRSEVEGHIDASLDWYLNQVARSRACLRADDPGAARLEAGESVRPLLQAAFVLHDRRRVPYYKYLGWEMEQRPLEAFETSPSTLVGMVTALVTDGSPRAQRRVLDLAEPVFRARGFGLRFEQWETDGWRAAGFGEHAAHGPSDR